MNRQIQEGKKTSYGLLLPLVFAIAFVPLIVHQFTYKTGLTVYDWFPDNTEAANDFFMVWKDITIVLLGVIMLAVMCYQKWKEKSAFRFENAFYLLLFYMLFVAMSALFSPYKRWVFRGTFELMEPVLVLFAYGVLCYYTYHVVRDEKKLMSLLRLCGIGVTIALVIGMFQTFGLNFFQSHFGKMLITNPREWGNLENITFGFGRTAYITLYNPDYVVFYVGIVLPILAACFINTKKVVMRIFLGILSAAAVISLIGSHATSGWMAVLVAALIGVFVLLSRDKKKFRIGMIIVVVTAVVGFAFVITSSRAQNLRNVIWGTYKADRTFGIKSIETDKDVCIDFNGIKTHFSYDSDREQGTMTIYCSDEDGNAIEQSQNDSGTSVFLDCNHAEYHAEPVFVGDDLGLRITIEDHEWVFVKKDDGTYYYYNAAGKYVKFPDMKHVQWFNEDAVSGRGHIWNKTIPVLGKHIFIGSGANTYLLEVPQEDYLFKNYTDTNNNFDVKAHSWYLQQWVENGMLAMLLLAAFYLWYFISSVRIYRRVSFKTNLHRIGYAIFIGLLVYMTAALANDSTVNVAPLYWAALGLGFAVNRMIVEQDEVFAVKVTEPPHSVEESSEGMVKAVVTVSKGAAKPENRKKQSRRERKKNGK